MDGILYAAVSELVAKLEVWIMGTFDLAVSAETSDDKVLETIDQLATKTYVIFTFFFIAGGVTLISLAVLHWFGKQHKTRGEVLSIFTTTVIGVALALVSLIAFLDDEMSYETPYTYFLNTSWVQPTVLLTFALGKDCSICHPYIRFFFFSVGCLLI